MAVTRRCFLISGLAAPALTLVPYANAATASDPLRLRELYNRDRSFSDLAKSLAGERITVRGFMAPPLKAESNFFVLTKMPMAVCPFCESEAEWPDDILAVYTKRTVDVVAFNLGIETRGVLELGPFKDPETGFLSMVRLSDATYG